jgi:hypothetical protein
MYRAFFAKIVKGPGPVHFVRKKSAICHKIVKKNDIIKSAINEILKPEMMKLDNNF